jgi:hypothetical protein
LKFSDPYDLASLFEALCPKKEQKSSVCVPAFEASLSKLWGLAFFYFGASLLGALDSLKWGPALFGSRAETGNKKPFGAPLFGASIFKFWGLTFLGTWALWDPALFGSRAETLKQGTKKGFGPSFLEPRFQILRPRVFWVLGLFGAPHWRTVSIPR